MNNLQIRFVNYAVAVLNLTESISNKAFYSRIIEQVNKSCTSIGANYSEAQSASSKKDFHNKVKIALKEARETEYWLLLLSKRKMNLDKIDPLLIETEEIIKILTAIAKKTDIIPR